MKRNRRKQPESSAWAIGRQHPTIPKAEMAAHCLDTREQNRQYATGGEGGQVIRTYSFKAWRNVPEETAKVASLERENLGQVERTAVSLRPTSTDT